MNIKQRLRKLESRAHDRLAAAAAECASYIAEDPPLTEEEARRLDIHELLRHIEVELHPSKVRESEAFARHCARFRRMPLMELFRLYRVLKRRHRKVQSRRQKAAFCKGRVDYYLFLCKIYGERTEAANRAEREALYAKRAATYHEPAVIAEIPHHTTPATNEFKLPTPRPSQSAWAIA